MAHVAESARLLTRSVLEHSEIEGPRFTERLVPCASIRMKLVDLRLLIVGYACTQRGRWLVLFHSVLVGTLLGYVVLLRYFVEDTLKDINICWLFEKKHGVFPLVLAIKSHTTHRA